MSDKFLDALRGINAISRRKTNSRVASSISSSEASSSRSCLPPPVQQLDLPTPTDKTQTFLDAGCSSFLIADQLSKEYRRLASQLRAKFQQAHLKKLQQQLAIEPTLASSYRRLARSVTVNYMHELEALEDAILKRIYRSQAENAPSSKPPTFNGKYLPLLEKCFASDPYPSVEIKGVLAKKTMMTLRQIEVWFQNRRTRGKKGGKLPKQSLPQERRQDMSTHREPTHIIPVPTPAPAPETDNAPCRHGSEQSPASQVFINDTPPPYAFPMKYPLKPEDCVHAPSPTGRGSFKVAAPIWPRTSTLIALERRPRVRDSDINSLCEDLTAKLHLRCPHKKPEKEPSIPWFPATVTKVPQAPYYAAITNPTDSAAETTGTSASSAPLSAQIPPVTNRLGSTNLPNRQHLTKETRRLAQLPYRRPSSQYTSRVKDTTHAFLAYQSSSWPGFSLPPRSSHSPTPSLRSSSSSSSLSSEISSTPSRRRSSSSSSGSSGASSEVTTPVLTPDSLPRCEVYTTPVFEEWEQPEFGNETLPSFADKALPIIPHTTLIMHHQPT